MPRFTKTFLALLFIALTLFALIACQEVTTTAFKTTSEPQTTEAPHGSSSAPATTRTPDVSAPITTAALPPETEETSESPVTSEPVEIKDPALFDGVMIHSVHGTGKNGAEAVISCGFIELYNQNKAPVSLNGASLYYKTDNGFGFLEFPFPENAIIPEEGYYLIRARDARDFNEQNAILRIESADAFWDTPIDNKEVTLILAPSHKTFDSEATPDTHTGINSIFVATETKSLFHFEVNDLSRNKIAVRTAKKGYSGYHLVNLTKRQTAELTALLPKASSGIAATVVASRLDEVLFSHPAGFYDSRLTLSLEAAAGYTVYYTLDGSDPFDKSNPARRTYSLPIVLESTENLPWGPVTNAWRSQNGAASPVKSTLPGARVVKAYATDGITSTAVFTNTYFISSSIEGYQIPVMSFSMPTDEIMGNNGFYSNYMPSGSITAPRPRGEGVMEVFDENGARVGYSTIEAAVGGNGSAGFAMKTLRLYYKGSLNETGGGSGKLYYDLFNGTATDEEGNPITSFERLLLRNSGNDCGVSYIRDAYMQRVSSDLDVKTMASRSVFLFINGEFWGVYNARERYSPEYVESHFGADKDNVALLESDYSQVHTNQNAPYVVASGEDGDADDFNNLVSFIRNNDMSNPMLYETVKNRMDVESFIDLWVVRLYFNAIDWPGNNIKVFRNKNFDDPSGMDMKWYFTLLDLDMGLSFYQHTSADDDIFGASINRGSVCGNMMCDLLENPEFKKQFILRYYTVVTEHFTPEKQSAVFEALYQERIALMPLQEARWGHEGASVNRFHQSANDIRAFIRERNTYALQALYRYFGINESYIEEIGYKKITFNFNPSRVIVYVNGEEIAPNEVLSFREDLLTLAITTQARDGFRVKGITLPTKNGATLVDADSTVFSPEASGTVLIHAVSTDADKNEGGKLIAGPTYLFYLTESGDLYAWGDNRYGVLGLDASMAVVTTPTLVMTNVAKVSTTAAAAYQNNDTVWMTAILTKNGKLYTVGQNTCGQLGRNGTVDSYELGEVFFNYSKIVDISCGYDHMLILDKQNVVWGVGSNSYGQLGKENEGGNALTFQKVAENAAAISGGRRSSAFIGLDGTLYGIGDNRFHKLSQSVGERTNTPVAMAKGIVFLSSGEHQTLSVDENGTLYYAGRRDFGSFTLANGNNPTMCRVMDGVREAYAYFDNMVILDEIGSVYVYGLNTQNAIGSKVTNQAPQKLLDGVVSIASGYGFSAFLTEDGSILVQGDNTFAQAGNGSVGGGVTLSVIPEFN